jgi:DNA-binding response OmpR family regulator
VVENGYPEVLTKPFVMAALGNRIRELIARPVANRFPQP